MGEKIGVIIIEKVTDESQLKFSKDKPDIRLE